MSEQAVQLTVNAGPRRSAAYRAAYGSAVVAAVFSLIVAGALSGRYLLDRGASPLADRSLDQLKAQLVADPENEALKTQIRELDGRIRLDHERRTRFYQVGGLMLVAGMIAFAAAAKTAWRLGLTPFLPTSEPPRTRPLPSLTAISIAGLALAAGLIALSSSPADYLISEKPLKTIPGRWAMFRGPAAGVALDGGYPDGWDSATARNILWKTHLDAPGFNSAVVWDGLVFIAAADEKSREVLCFAAADGELRWRRNVAVSNARVPEVFAETGFAASTCATDGQRVYAIFATGDLAAFDFAGHRVWEKSLGTPDSVYGYSSSLLTWNQMLVVQFDVGSDPKKPASYLLALDGATGNELWRTPRPVINSWTSPILVGDTVITASNPYVIAYDVRSGSEKWREKGLSGDVAPSPAYADGMVFVCNDGAELLGIRLESREGQSRVVWKSSEDLPDVASPVAFDGLVYMLTTGGTLSAVDAATGEQVWAEKLDGHFHPSPVIADGRLYVINREGVTRVIRPGRRYELLAEATIEDEIDATPAFAGGRIYIRGRTYLWCLGQTP